ncbi:hypothetical protein AB0C93_16215 [Streptomyces sp. NPDC048518]|uniref:hypothetical protein n=1 Tax=Streptomyces sp. NPDC048518 TaxID=3155029 RepID=UPI0033C12ACF
MQTTRPPHIPANELRPGRHWYVTAALTAAVLIVLGAVIGVYRLTHVTDAVDTGHPFRDGDTVTVRLGPESDKAIWISERGPSPDQECDITGPGDPRLTSPGIDVYLTRDEAWNPLRTIEVSRTGDYEVTCSSKGPSRYAIGDPEGHVGFLAGLVPAVLLPVLGVGIGAAVALVTFVRRRGHRRRLLAGHPAR